VKQKKMIFVTGLPRAMTTLLCNVLANNPRIGGGETSPLLEYVYGARHNFSTTPEVKSALTDEEMTDSFLAFCKGGMNAYAEQITDKEIYLDKSRGWIHYAPFLWKFNPDAKIIVCVRDLRSIVSSLEKKWRDNPEVIDNRDQPNNQAFVTIDQRANHFLNDAPLGIALKRLNNAIGTKTLDRMHIVKAEDFTSNPEKVMKGVYQFIGEDYYEMDYSNVEQKTIENDRINDFGIYGDHKIRKEITPLLKDSNEILGTTICQQIKAGFGWFYDTFKYY
jgi:sulfotransferase